MSGDDERAGRAAAEDDLKRQRDPMVRRNPALWRSQTEAFRRGYDAVYRSAVLDAFLRGYSDTRRLLEQGPDERY